MRTRWSTLLAVLLLGACGAEPAPAPPAPSLPEQWPTAQGTGVREVPLPGGQLLGYVPELASGHVLCAAVADWPAVVRGEHRAEVFLTDQCHVVSARYELTARLSHDAVPGSDTVAGRRARTDRQHASTDLDVELAAEEQARAYPGYRPTLSVTVKLREPGAEDTGGVTAAIAKAAAEAMLARAAGEGPPLPPLTERGELAQVTPTPPLAGFGVADQPLPVAAAQLCTLLAEAVGADPARAVAFPNGRCSVRGRAETVEAELTQAGRDPGYTETVAGRPVRRDPERTWVGLRDGSPQQVALLGRFDRLDELVARLVGR
ncbi:hypothetical protein JOF53_006678 [Crossiella equi]|uniref:Uncharacterized protein n=1 Tax=Crossiella equi TaxID=130796 RepID=A0ABS5AMM0_9PSEU|nr:hypothetical protein [Crossiella equi]MBP2477806.1 hypothetical protein [Crossiella equi]